MLPHPKGPHSAALVFRSLARLQLCRKERVGGPHGLRCSASLGLPHPLAVPRRASTACRFPLYPRENVKGCFPVSVLLQMPLAAAALTKFLWVLAPAPSMQARKAPKTPLTVFLPVRRAFQMKQEKAKTAATAGVPALRLLKTQGSPMLPYQRKQKSPP